MSHSVTPHTHDAQPRSVGLLVWFLTLSFWPRLFLLGFWIFSTGLGDAYNSWIVPAIGFLIAPSTTFSYALMWVGWTDGVHGAEWIVVAVGVLLDLWMWGSLQRLMTE
jgi:hypothetical protein